MIDDCDSTKWYNSTFLSTLLLVLTDKVDNKSLKTGTIPL